MTCIAYPMYEIKVMGEQRKEKALRVKKKIISNNLGFSKDQPIRRLGYTIICNLSIFSYILVVTK